MAPPLGPVRRLPVPRRSRARGIGVYTGTNLLTGGSGSALDPFEAYTCRAAHEPEHAPCR
ncbi:MAG: hypothetical protein R2710_30020 [Acidimicrobiales bacterium]